MAVWTNLEKANIRHYLGYSGVFIQADPRLDNAIQAVLATADGGTRPDNSEQVQIQGWLTELATTDTNLATLRGLAAVGMPGQVGKIMVDPYRGMVMLRSEGRRLVNNICKVLSANPRSDIYSQAKANSDGSPFPDIDGGGPNVRW